MKKYELFLKYNSKTVRGNMQTDYYTSQDSEKLIYNIENQKKNYLKSQEEINAKK